MRLNLSMLASTCAVVALTSALPYPSTDRPGPPPEEPRIPPVLSPTAVEPPIALVEVGDNAPDFSWQAEDDQWRKLRDLRAQGHVLLVFGADAPHLAALERERDRLLDLGVLPVAVMDRSAGAARGLARKLHLTCTVIADPQLAIAEQFNTVDAVTRRSVPAWFVVDRAGRVRALDRSMLPGKGFTHLAASALALPEPGVALPSSRRR